jgi:hypothetical protein
MTETDKKRTAEYKAHTFQTDINQNTLIDIYYKKVSIKIVVRFIH